jgi:hypothetical protein
MRFQRDSRWAQRCATRSSNARMRMLAVETDSRHIVLMWPAPEPSRNGSGDSQTSPVTRDEPMISELSEDPDSSAGDFSIWMFEAGFKDCVGPSLHGFGGVLFPVSKHHDSMRP